MSLVCRRSIDCCIISCKWRADIRTRPSPISYYFATLGHVVLHKIPSEIVHLKSQYHAHG
ncbi:hypothetical protein DPMN_061620 [Dreissena polymorpha]|uniref:Uncharacterized protein n=1 Tax=Dreissena polymorpha TaxID=45954 RepID=A0A9D4C813_DREPO|nr:hypothetical protein DPMN_061620 [Dreissena polymorpha]